MGEKTLKTLKYGIKYVESTDQFIDPAEYGVDIRAIRRLIHDLSSTPEDERSREQFTKDTLESYAEFARTHIGIDFKDIILFITALTHRSYVNEHRNVRVEHSERLEFLGDAILELVVSDFLYRLFDEQEGIMTAWRASLVRTESIGEASIKLGFPEMVRLSRGEQLQNERNHLNIYADCFEAVTGAIYIDQGYESAKRFVYEHIISKFASVLEAEAWRDPKSHLQEISQKNEGVIPQYHLKKVEGPDHSHIFTIELTIGNRIYGHGTGKSKQEAQTLAAIEGLEKYKKEMKTRDDGKLASGRL